MRVFDLEERLVSFASSIIKMVNSLPNSFAASHLGKQIIRSATSVALNYGKHKLRSRGLTLSIS
ncbi:MAG: four helix bundle protein [Bacteroidota bacterium]